MERSPLTAAPPPAPPRAVLAAEKARLASHLASLEEASRVREEQLQAGLKAAQEEAGRARGERRHAEGERDRAARAAEGLLRELEVTKERLRAEVRR